MISIELIIPSEDRRLWMRVSESISVGDLKKFVRSFFSLKNSCFIMFSGRGELPDEMSLADAGLGDGSGVMIGIEDEY